MTSTYIKSAAPVLSERLRKQHHTYTRVLGYLRACLHEGGRPQVGEVTRLTVVER